MVTPNLGQRSQERLAGDAELLKTPSRGAGCALVSQRDQQVLDGDVLVLEPLGVPLGGVQYAGQPLGDEHLTGGRAGPSHLRPALQVTVDGSP